MGSIWGDHDSSVPLPAASFGFNLKNALLHTPQAMLVQAVIPTLRTILCAPTGSPIRAIRPQEFVDMVMCLTSAVSAAAAASPSFKR